MEMSVTVSYQKCGKVARWVIDSAAARWYSTSSNIASSAEE